MSTAREMTPYGLSLLADKAAKEAANDLAALPFTVLKAWIGREIPDRHYLIDPLIPGQCVTSLYGDGGSGKTLMAIWLMVCMASRYKAPWLGYKPLGWKSVGLFAEDDEEELIRRLRRICDGAGVEFDAVADHISLLPCVGQDTTVAYFSDTGELVITPLMRGLIAKMQTEGAHLLVIDYAAAVFGGNELDRYQVSEFMRRLNAIARENDIAILLLGHPSMDGMKGGRGTSGSTAWRNQARSFLQLTVDDVQDDPDGRRLLTLHHAKANYSGSGTKFRLASDGSRFEILETSIEASRPAKGPRLSSSQKVALKALQRAITEAGEASPGGMIPNGARVVQISLWREYAYSMGISQAGTAEARKKAFGRAVQDLTAKGAVGVAEPYAWTVEEPSQ